ncbi:hypothetical protein SOPP22_13850 [Shewanella sp. OPT22]|nr:hypothetical protein SOPP22_13850 [Shewanella sp. OPT22]
MKLKTTVLIAASLSIMGCRTNPNYEQAEKCADMSGLKNQQCIKQVNNIKCYPYSITKKTLWYSCKFARSLIIKICILPVKQALQ